MEPNPQFSIDKVLHPCKVTKSLLIDLERTILATVEDVARGGKGVKRSVSLVITDDRGDEKLHSGEAIVGTLFHDSVSAVSLEVSMQGNGSDSSAALLATVRLKFSQKARPSLQIIMQCPRAREQAIGLEERIGRILDPNIDDAWYFHTSKDGLDSLSIFCGMGIVFWLFYLSDAITERDHAALASNTFLFWTVLFTLIPSYVVVCRRYFPPSTFDTKQRASMDEQKSWAKKTVWSLVGVNVVAASVGGLIVDRIGSLFAASL
jgi:hypothetical protein